MYTVIFSKAPIVGKRHRALRVSRASYVHLVCAAWEHSVEWRNAYMKKAWFRFICTTPTWMGCRGEGRWATIVFLMNLSGPCCLLCMQRTATTVLCDSCFSGISWQPQDPFRNVMYWMGWQLSHGIYEKIAAVMAVAACNRYTVYYYYYCFCFLSCACRA